MVSEAAAVFTPEQNSAIQAVVDETMYSGSDVNGIWYLIGAAWVFFMQCGFAMVETGMTRSKNAGNIIMKNLMDFCIGTVVFILLGFGLLLGEDTLFGLVGIPNLDILGSFSDFNRCAEFVFNLVFCATAATIVSGAMAERTKFLSYCIYSGVISAIVYPIEAHWIWGGGWLAQMGFVDFAGSTCIHMVGGLCALIGAKMVGPRIGKFGKDGKPNAILGHSMTRRPRRIYPVVRLVRLQRRRSLRYSLPRKHLPYNNSRSCGRNLHDDGIHMAQARQARCLHVP